MSGDFSDNEHNNLGGKASDAIRKLLVSGLSTASMTEEGIRNALSDLPLPKDAVHYVLSQTEKGRQDLYRTVSDEMKTFLRGLNLTGELRQALVGLRLEVKGSIRILEDSVESTVTTETTETTETTQPPQPDKPTPTTSESPD